MKRLTTINHNEIEMKTPKYIALVDTVDCHGDHRPAYLARVRYRRIEIKGRYGNHISWRTFTLKEAAQVFRITCIKAR